MKPWSGLAIFSWFGRSLPLGERLRMIRDAGFDGVMLWGDPKEEAFNQADMARRLGLEVVNCHLPFESAGSLWTEKDSDGYLLRLKQGLAYCRGQGVDTAVFHATDFAASVPVTVSGIARIRELVDEAERLEVSLAIENLGRLDHLEVLLDRIDSPRFGFCFDAGHEYCSAYPSNCLERFGHRLKAVHLHDNMGDDDTHLLPLDGSNDWPQVMDRLQKTAPLPHLCLEADANPVHPESARYQGLSTMDYLIRAREQAEALRRLPIPRE